MKTDDELLDFKNNERIKFLKSKIWRPLTQEFYDLSSRIAVKAKGIFIIDQNNNKIADLNSSWWVNSHGHCNKKISKAIKKQIDILDGVVFADFLHKPALLLIEKLYNLINKNINQNKSKFEKFFFADNGSTSIEIALKIAHQFHINKQNYNKTKIISFKGNYHGDTFGSMSVGAKSGYFDPFKKLFFEVIFLDFPDTFLKDNLKTLEKKEQKIIQKLENILKKEKDKISSIILEPIIQGANGMKMARISFLRKIIEICKKNEILVIFDEVMTGLGRTGEMFSFEKICKNKELFSREIETESPFDSTFTPDIIALSKILSAGFLPFGIVGCTKNIYDVFYSQNLEKTFLHSHSYTGNPITSACVLENLKIFENEDIIKKIKNIEKFFIDFGSKLSDETSKNKNSLIEKIRFCGTIFCFEVNKEKFLNIRKKPFLSRQFREVLLQNKIYIRPIDNNIFIIPPYIIKINQLERYIKKIIKILNSY